MTFAFKFINVATFVFLVLSLILVCVFYGYAKRYGKNRRLKALFKNTAKLTNKTRKGDYIRFTGKVTFPDELTPVTKQPCCYWAVRIWAIFQSKRKKPGKGMQTHTPLLYSAASGDKPLIVTNGQQVVNIMIESFTSALLNAPRKKTEHASPPLEEIKDKIKPKYKTYRSVELWLPRNASVTLVGTVAAVNQNMVSVTGSRRANRPLLVFKGDIRQLYDYCKYAIRFFYYRLLIFGLGFTVAWSFAVLEKDLVVPLVMTGALAVYAACSKSGKK